jgi:acetylornithine deacetylase/succinyl-diaminopimelate desuccinylase-like protein
MDVDMRSESPDALNKVVADFHAIVQEAVAEENAARSTKEGKVEAEVTLIGDRPSGETPVNSSIVQNATAVLKSFGLTPHYSISSTTRTSPSVSAFPPLRSAADRANERTP